MDEKLTPGLAHLKLKYTLSTEFDESLEEITPPEIHTNFLDLFDVSLTEAVINMLVLNHEKIIPERHDVTWLRKPEYISADYYKRQENRSELIKEQAKKQKVSVDYNEIVKNSFLHIDSHPDEFEAWELFPGDEEYSSVIFIEEAVPHDFIFLKEEGNRVFGIKDSEEQVYAAINQDASEYLIIELEEDEKAYYKRISKNLRLKQTKLPKSEENTENK